MKKLIIIPTLLTMLFSVIVKSQSKEVKPKVTFIELGSVNCIP